MINVIDRETFTATLGNYGADNFGGALSQKVVDDLIGNHCENKGHIFELFGRKLKIKKEIETVVNSSEAKKIRDALVAELDGKKLIFVREFLKAISMQEFLDNKISNNYYILNVKIERGLKLSKALKKLCLEDEHHRVVTAHSMANQKLTTKGTAVLSIDPIDYLTMSSNASGWKSCHRLNGGEYCTGPLAYLNDSSTVICYIESKTPCKFSYQGKEYTHSNKTWRQIALVSPELEYSIQERQYPNSNSINSNSVSEMFADVFNEYYQTEDFGYAIADIEDLKELHRDYADYEDGYRLYYNDIESEMFNDGGVVFNKKETSLERLVNLPMEDRPLKGSHANCLSCGETLYDSESLYCDYCIEDNDYDDDDEY